MKVSVRHDNKFAAILTEPEFARLVEIVQSQKAALVFLAQVLKKYLDASELLTGPGGSGWSVEKYAEAFSLYNPRAASTADNSLREIGEVLLALYQRHDPNHVRGAVLEGLVEERLRTRYEATLLENNVFVDIENGVLYQTSRSVDVVGWDGKLGEAHDCKTRAQRFARPWVSELERELFPRGLEIGLVTADSYRAALAKLRTNGVVLGNAQVVSLERLWDFAPLQT